MLSLFSFYFCNICFITLQILQKHRNRPRQPDLASGPGARSRNFRFPNRLSGQNSFFLLVGQTQFRQDLLVLVDGRRAGRREHVARNVGRSGTGRRFRQEVTDPEAGKGNRQAPQPRIGKRKTE